MLMRDHRKAGFDEKKKPKILKSQKRGLVARGELVWMTCKQTTKKCVNEAKVQNSFSSSGVI